MFVLGSDIVHLDLCGTSVIVLNTAEAAFDLLESKSLIYSDRYAQHIMYAVTN